MGNSDNDRGRSRLDLLTTISKVTTTPSKLIQKEFGAEVTQIAINVTAIKSDRVTPILFSDNVFGNLRDNTLLFRHNTP